MFKNNLYKLGMVLGLVAMMSGCAVNRATATLTPGTDLTKVRSIYVQKEEGDDREVDSIIKKNLTDRGFTVMSGDGPQAPGPVDAKLTYVDKWMWDITMYMIELTITLRDPKSDFPMAVGNSLHTSLTRLSPEEMVNEVVGNILKAKADGQQQAQANTK